MSAQSRQVAQFCEQSNQSQSEIPFITNGNYEHHKFGKESTVDQIVRRIAFEIELEGYYRKIGHNANADAHALARMAYSDLLGKK